MPSGEQLERCKAILIKPTPGDSPFGATEDELLKAYKALTLAEREALISGTTPASRWRVMLRYLDHVFISLENASDAEAAVLLANGIYMISLDNFSMDFRDSLARIDPFLVQVNEAGFLPLFRQLLNDLKFELPNQALNAVDGRFDTGIWRESRKEWLGWRRRMRRAEGIA